MLPHQKYPSAYRGYSQGQQMNPPPSSIPQSPFDAVYGSSLLPRQLLVSSPFVQVQSPLPSPVHGGHPHHQYYQSRQSSYAAPNGYFAGPPVPKLHMPPRKHADTTPTKRKSSKVPDPLSTSETIISSETSSLDETSSVLEFHPDHNLAESDNLRSDSSNSLNQLYPSTNTSSLSNISPSQSNVQISRSPTRSIMLTNVHPELTITKLLDFIHFGPIENVRVIENHFKDGLNSIVLSFLKTETCLHYFNSVLTYLSKFRKLIQSPELSINFIHSKKTLPFISYAISNDGATRNVYIGNLNSLSQEVDEEFIRTEFLKFGIIDKIDLVEKTVRKSTTENDDENIEELEKFAFVHFTTIASAIKTVEQLSLNPFWEDAKIFYGTDRCSIQNDSLVRSIIDEGDDSDDSGDNYDQANGTYTNEYFRSNSQHPIEFDDGTPTTIQYVYPEPQQTFVPPSPGAYALYPSHSHTNMMSVKETLNKNHNAALALASNHGGRENAGNRTICLTNIDLHSKVEDICNVVRGGNLQNIKHLVDRRTCFITFIDSVAAAQFYANAQVTPLVLHGRKLRVGWGAHQGPLSTQIALAVTIGASRNVYIGVGDDQKDEIPEGTRILPTEQELREDFSKFGDIEQINFFRNDLCVFLNFHNISNAIKVVTDANGHLSSDFHEFFNNKYKGLKISYGKDRCGNQPKTKKRKRNRRKKNNRETVDEEGEGNDEGDAKEQDGDKKSDKFNGHKVEEVPVELFESMGISQKTDDSTTPAEQEVTEKEVDAFGITNGQSSKKETFSTLSSHEEEDSDNEDLDDVEEGDEDPNSSTGIEILVGGESDELNKENENKSELKLPKKTRASPLNNDDDTSPPRVYQPRKVPNHQRRQNSKFNSNASSRVSSQVSLNSLYEPSYQHDYYKSIPFAPPPLSRGSSRSNLSSFYAPQQHGQYNNLNGHGAGNPNVYDNYNTTSGLQVMAQYLQQSQHANLLYAANVLNAVNNNNGPGYDYGSGYEYQRRPSRRERRQ